MTTVLETQRCHRDAGGAGVRLWRGGWRPSLLTAATHPHAYTHAHTCTHMHTHAHTCTHMHTHAHTCTRMHTHGHTRKASCARQAGDKQGTHIGLLPEPQQRRPSREGRVHKCLVAGDDVVGGGQGRAHGLAHRGHVAPAPRATLSRGDEGGGLAAQGTLASEDIRVWGNQEGQRQPGRALEGQPAAAPPRTKPAPTPCHAQNSTHASPRGCPSGAPQRTVSSQPPATRVRPDLHEMRHWARSTLAPQVLENVLLMLGMAGQLTGTSRKQRSSTRARGEARLPQKGWGGL
jgi:hypothetical protein